MRSHSGSAEIPEPHLFIEVRAGNPTRRLRKGHVSVVVETRETPMKSTTRRKDNSVFAGCFRLALVLVAGAPASAPRQAQAQALPSKEYQIKAVFLFNFAQFVEWPATAFPDADAPIRIGVLGDDPFGTALEETVRGETIRNRKLVVQHSRQVEDLKNCQLLFISKSEKRRIPEILSTLNPGAVLTVGEIESFSRLGGIINFYLDGNKVRFEINPAAAQRQGLKLSSQLLNLGKVVASGPEKGNP
jgi:hypothetical protein